MMQLQHQFDVCSICSSTSIHRKQSNGSSYSIFCHKCGHLFFSPTSFDLANIQADQERHFNDTFAYQQDQFTELYEKFNYRRLKNEIHRDRKYKILEIGPGRGFVLHYLEKYDGHQVSGLDISVEVIKHIRERFGINVMQGFIGQDVRLLNNNYDYILMRHCLEHFPDPINILTILRKNLKLESTVFRHAFD